MVKLLISFLNTLLFLALALVFSHNWVVLILAAFFIWNSTFFALCLSTMVARKINVLCMGDYPQSKRVDFYR